MWFTVKDMVILRDSPGEDGYQLMSFRGTINAVADASNKWLLALELFAGSSSCFWLLVGFLDVSWPSSNASDKVINNELRSIGFP